MHPPALAVVLVGVLNAAVAWAPVLPLPRRTACQLVVPAFGFRDGLIDRPAVVKREAPQWPGRSTGVLFTPVSEDADACTKPRGYQACLTTGGTKVSIATSTDAV